MSVKVFTGQTLDQLSLDAAKTSRGRLHLNVHQSFDEPVQRLFNAIGMNSYIRPHRHLNDHPECLVGIRGEMTLIVFDEAGEIRATTRFGSTVAGVTELSAGVEVPPGVWHTVLANREGAILFEVKAGPFSPAVAKEFACWAPEEGSGAATSYLATLKRAALPHENER